MPWPDFTELTFGYAYLRELERRNTSGGSFPLAPDFISQNDEAEKGYDVEVTLDGATPLFIQFKRSFVVTRSNGKEVLDGTYGGPQIFRMHLHKRGAYRQHKALQRLEADGHTVQYVTSQIYTQRQFQDAFAQQRIVSSASAHFLPSEIALPDEVDDHHVSFKADESYGYIYSDEAQRFDRKGPNFDAWASRMRERRRSFKDNQMALEKAVQAMSLDMPGRLRIARATADRQPFARRVIAEPFARILRNKPIEQQASILAYLTLDAQLIFLRDL